MKKHKARYLGDVLIEDPAFTHHHLQALIGQWRPVEGDVCTTTIDGLPGPKTPYLIHVFTGEEGIHMTKLAFHKTIAHHTDFFDCDGNKINGAYKLNGRKTKLIKNKKGDR